MNPKEMIVSIAAAMMVAAVFASSAMAINVDGNSNSYAGEWTTGDWVTNDPCGVEGHGMGDWGYNLKALYQHYDDINDVLYFRIDVCGIPADYDGNGNTDTVCNPSDDIDCAGVSEYESYTLTLTSTGHTGTHIRYSDNAVTHTDADAQWGTNCIEFELSNASTYVDPGHYCITATGGADPDDHAEDRMEGCVDIAQVPPTARLRGSGCAPEPVTLDGCASHANEPGATIVKYEWDFENDGTYDRDTGTTCTTIYTWTTPGSYPVKLRVTDSNGLTDDVVKTFRIPPCDQEVPVLTPIGTVALIGLLGLIGVGIIMRRR